jgi:hypothetical protein
MTTKITKHISKTNASYRNLNAGDAKNTDLFLDNDYYELFKDCGEKITVRFHRSNLEQAILFIASVLPQKYDNSSRHYEVQYSTEFVLDQLAILHSLFRNGDEVVSTVTQEWNLRKSVTQKNGKIDQRFYFNGLLKQVTYKNARGEVCTEKFTIRNYLAGGYSDLHITKADDGIFDIEITNTTTPYTEKDELSGATEEQQEQTAENNQKALNFISGLHNDLPRNRIIFGAPGTGKSFFLDDERKKLLELDCEVNYERVTFHPDYSYANFVGTYKPVMNEQGDISYRYVPGPFMRIYKKALENAVKAAEGEDTPRPFLLIIEEINRANVAAVFGDVFQLLDRNDTNISEYPIHASEDIKKYLGEIFNRNHEDFAQIRIPDNLFIWATMNSADQGVFPMDTAFKRRWDFKYLGIDENEKLLKGKYVEINGLRIEWNSLRKCINEYLAEILKIPEDKQLGPFFIPRKIVFPESHLTGEPVNEIDKVKFSEVFEHKVLMYLFEDAARQNRASLFEDAKYGSARYSKICDAFREQGIGIFNSQIRNNKNLKIDVMFPGFHPEQTAETANPEDYGE